MEMQIKLFPALIKNPYTLGLYEAFTKRDMRHLLNVLYQSSRHEAICFAGVSSGYDHCRGFFMAVNALAGNDGEIVSALLPKELGISKNGHSFLITATNLMSALWNKDSGMLEKVKTAAVKYLSGKRTVLERAIVEYLYALSENDTAAASSCLKNLCAGARKSKEDSKLVKCFCKNAHGLYNLAYFILTKDDFNKIEQPDDDGFIKQFAQWNIENGFPKGELFLEYSGEMEIFNVILNIDVPKVSLHMPYNIANYNFSKTLFMDSEAFEKELIDRVIKKLRTSKEGDAS